MRIKEANTLLTSLCRKVALLYDARTGCPFVWPAHSVLGPLRLTAKVTRT